MPALLSSNIKYNQLVPIVLIMFMFNPMLTLVGLLLYGLSIGNAPTKDRTQGFLILFGIVCCVAVSLINMTKVPEGDLWDYVDQYRLAGRLSYYRFLLEAPEDTVDTIKEPAYYTIVWLMNRLFQGNETLFLFSLSMLEYILVIYALIYFGKYYGMRLYVVMTSIIIMCFLPYIFIHSLNIVRQTLANSLLLFIIIRRFFYEKKDWVLILIMIFIHSSSALFLPLLLIPTFGKSFKKSWILYVGTILLLLAYQLVASYFLGVGDLNQVSAVTNALERAERGNLGDYSIAILTMIVTVVSLLYSIYVYAGKVLPSSEGLRKFLSVVIVLSIFILLISDQTLVANRFGHYEFTFFPFLLMVFLQETKIDKSLQFIVCIATMLFLSYFIYHTVFKFEIDMAGWVTPVYFYIF